MKSVCTHTSIYTHMCKFARHTVNVHIYMYTCVYLHPHAQHRYVFMYSCSHTVYLYAPMVSFLCTCIYVHTYTHILNAPVHPHTCILGVHICKYIYQHTCKLRVHICKSIHPHMQTRCAYMRIFTHPHGLLV